MKSSRLQISTLVRIGQSIALIAAVLAVALMVIELCRQPVRDGMAPPPGTEQTSPAPGQHHIAGALV